jgi:DNA polymerase I-like protein with 3'-5' exonuclease and polymerase domains
MTEAHDHSDGNCHYPTQLMERCRELDPTFKVTFLVHDEIQFECREENREAIMDLMMDHMKAVLKEGHVTLDVKMRVEF